MKRWRCGVAQEFVFEIQSAVVYNVDCFSTRIRPLLFSCNWMNEAIGDNKGVCIAAHLDKNLRARQRREMTTRSSMHLLLYLVSWMCMSINSTSCCLKSSAEAWCQWTNQEIPCSTFMCSSRMQIQLHKLTRYDRRESVRKTILLEIDDHDARFTDVTFNGILTRFDERCRAIASDLPCSRYRVSLSHMRCSRSTAILFREFFPRRGLSLFGRWMRMTTSVNTIFVDGILKIPYVQCGDLDRNGNDICVCGVQSHRCERFLSRRPAYRV